MSLRLALDLYVAAVGLIAGSYLNVVIHRLPLSESTVLPQSRCPRCGARIRAFDNIPLVSFLLLRGRCRSCRDPISWRYPLVETLTGLLFVGVFEWFGLTLHGFVAVTFGCMLIALAGIDLEHYILPDAITLPGAALGIAASPWLPWIRWQEAVIGAVLGGASLWIVGKLWLLLRHEEGMGLGDVKMLAMIGAFLGWQGVLVTIFLGSLTGSAVGLALIAVKGVDMRTKLPFGVFLSAGALAALFIGPWLVASYGRLL